MSKEVMTVGIDVGAEELWVAVKGRKPRSVGHDRAGIESLHRWVGRQAKGATVHYCLEATGVYGVHVASRLVSRDQVRVSIVNPAVIAAFGKTRLKRSKTDQIDAELIRLYAEQHHPAPWYPESRALRQLNLLVAQADALKNMLLRWDNRGHSHQFVLDLPAELTHTQRSVRRSLERQIERIEHAINNLCATEAELAQQVALLETIPGIARVSATRLLAYGGSRWQRYSARAMTAQAGLAPRHHRSGSSIDRKQRIDKQGDKRLRKTLYMPALVASSHNPALKKHYQRLCACGKPKKLALVACMRKLLVIAQAVIRTKKPFKPATQLLT